MKRYLKSLIIPAVLALLVLPAATRAADNDPTGTWKWSNTGQNGQTRETTLKLKKEGDKLTGKVSGRNGNETDIENGKVSGDEVSFDVTREFNGNKMTAKYKGKVSGDSITGKVETERDGQTRSRDWNAKREGSKSAANSSSSNFTGKWKYKVEFNGNSFEPVIDLKQEGDKVTGHVTGRNNSETPLLDPKVEGDHLTFRTERERDGNKFTSKYDAKLVDGKLKGKVMSNFNGNERTYDFEATKE